MAPHPYTENSVKIAVLEEQIRGIREQQKAHAESTEKRFDGVEEKLDVLVATFNKGKGAYATIFLLSGVIGAGVIKVVTLLVHWIRPI